MASVPDPEPHLMIIQRRQPSRKTRPPVVSSKLLHHPYVSGAFTEPPPLNTKYLIIEAQFGVPEISKRRRRRKGKERKERAPPQYYRPNPRWEGKCRGYGFGYPSSFAMTDKWKYERDTLK